MRRIRRRRVVRRVTWGRWHWVGTALVLILICGGAYVCRFSGLLR